MNKKTKSTRATYIDAFVLVVPRKRIAEYKKMAKEGAELWMKHGALSYRECMGNELNPNMGGWTFLPFPKLAKLKAGETVWFSYIEYRSKKHRDTVNKKVMKAIDQKHKDKKDNMKNMPFDQKRFSYGGFSVEISA